MSRLRRRLALATGRLILRLLPTPLEAWGWAMLHEIEGIDDDAEALGFALDALRGAVSQLIAFHLTGGSTDMTWLDALRRPRTIGIGCAIGASGLGVAYMAMAGAPMRYLAVNAGALAMGLLVFAIAGGRGAAARLPGGITLALGGLLLATALFGNRVEGASRWLTFGPLFLQPSLIVLPMMIVGFARERTALATTGLMTAALALALQPDRAMAGMLAAGLAALAVFRPDRQLMAALVSAVIGFAATIVRPDTLPAVPYVDQILYLAFEVNRLAGLAVLAGSALLLVPAIAGLRDPDDREACAALATVWVAAIAAAALGNYPTPVVGYGGSAVIGYVLSLAVLPRAKRARIGEETVDRESAAPTATTTHLPTGLYSAG